MIVELETKEYSFKFEKDSMRQARVVFEKRNDSEGIWKLRECKYFGVGNVYDIDDWDFLHHLSSAILKQYKYLINAEPVRLSHWLQE